METILIAQSLYYPVWVFTASPVLDKSSK